MRRSTVACGLARTVRGVQPLLGCAVGFALGAGLLSGCATGAYQQGERSARAGDWEPAVASYQRALREAPGRADVRIALERAKLNASRHHIEVARAFEARNDLAGALAEYQTARGYDPSNGQTRDRIAAIDYKIRDRSDTPPVPRPPIAPVDQDTQRLLLAPPSSERLSLQFTDASLRDILDFIGDAAGIDVVYDPGFRDRSYSVQLDDVTVEEALEVVLTANHYFYKVVSPRAIRATSAVRPTP